MVGNPDSSGKISDSHKFQQMHTHINRNLDNPLSNLRICLDSDMMREQHVVDNCS